MVAREDEERILKILRDFGVKFEVYRCMLEIRK